MGYIRVWQKIRDLLEKIRDLLGFRVQSVVGASLVTVGVLVMFCGSALGFVTHPYLGQSFGPGGAQSGDFVNVQSIAVDQRSEDVFVFDAGAGALYKFDSSGAPATFSKLAKNAIEGLGSAGNDENEIAVDSSTGPAAGDLYLDYYGSGVVSIFDATGQLLGSLSSAGTLGTGEPCGVAVDPAGNLYVALSEGSVNRYTPTTNPVTTLDYNSSLSGLRTFGETCNIAVDGEGDVYVATYPGGPVTRYPAGQFNTTGAAAKGTPVDGIGSTVAVDPASDHSYVNEGNAIAEFDPSGEHLRGISGNSPGLGAIIGSYGVAVNGSSGGSGSGDLYASNGSGEVNIYGPGETLVLPVKIDSESVTAVSLSSATIAANINPVESDTRFFVQYGTAKCSNDASACVQMPSAPGEDIGASEGDVGVSQTLRNLTPGTIYHYRVVAKNAFGEVDGAEHVFTTQEVTAGKALLDGRQWEKVSPSEKNGSLITSLGGMPGTTSGGVVQAAADGGSLTYVSNGAFDATAKGAPLDSQYVSARGPNGWSTTDITESLASLSYVAIGEGGPFKAFSSDLSTGLMLNGRAFNHTPVKNPPIEGTGAPEGYEDLYLRDNGSGSFTSILTSPPNVTAGEFEMAFEGANPALTHIVFQSRAALTPNATAYGEGYLENLYEWSDGEIRLVNLLPHESKSIAGAWLAGNTNGNAVGVHAISDDGSRVFFEELGGIYMRTAGASTSLVGQGTFVTASSDGSHVFYLNGGELYEYNVVTEQTNGITASGGVLGVLGASTDGSYVYVVSNAMLANATSSGGCTQESTRKLANECNVYVFHREGASWVPKFITRLSEEDNVEQVGLANDWSLSLVRRTSRVTSDGHGVVFLSDGDLTGYDNREIGTNRLVDEVYAYDALSGVLTCVSCDMSGARPSGPSSIPGGTTFAAGRASYQSRVLSDLPEGGQRVFFESSDALVPRDTNGKQDVYEWESGGTGSCQAGSGCVDLISSGTSGDEAAFLDADTDGSNVFFLTQAALTPDDADSLTDIYDARVGGVTANLVAEAQCSGTGCQGTPPSPPIFATPAAVTFEGIGNFPPPKKVSASKKKTKNVIAKHQKKKKKRAKAPKHRVKQLEKDSKSKKARR